MWARRYNMVIVDHHTSSHRESQSQYLLFPCSSDVISVFKMTCFHRKDTNLNGKTKSEHVVISYKSRHLVVICRIVSDARHCVQALLVFGFRSHCTTIVFFSHSKLDANPLKRIDNSPKVWRSYLEHVTCHNGHVIVVELKFCLL
jgi:hypothetical protein